MKARLHEKVLRFPPIIPVGDNSIETFNMWLGYYRNQLRAGYARYRLLYGEVDTFDEYAISVFQGCRDTVEPHLN